MSLYSQPTGSVLGETARIARQACPKGMQLLIAVWHVC